MADTNIDRLRQVLDELFMFDRADLDFGLYRIMNVRRDEIRTFLHDHLEAEARKALGDSQAGEREAIQAQIAEATEQARRLGIADPSQAPRVRELQAEYDGVEDTTATEAEVYGHLVSFFRRYYKEGDFISLRRYKEGVYAIPYEGEEVKLHWANADQYYIKSTEQFRDYTFLVSHADEEPRRVHFRLVEADTERNNNRAQAGQDRRFILAPDSEGEPAVAEVDGELVVRFEYRPDTEGRRQAALDEAIEAAVLDAPAAAAWRSALTRDARRPDDNGRAKEPLTLLRKHISTYTAKNAFDYFIHKDLGGFLRRELDFYIKSEVVRLDDIAGEDGSTANLASVLRKVKAIRAVASPVIDFLASLEEFQKRLWLKKKFVVETHWCVTLDRVPRELYAEVAANDRQREEWVRLFAIDAIEGDMVSPAYSEPMTEAFLEANQHLVLDTSLFDRDFTERLLAGLEDLDEAADGLLVHGDNFQALNALGPRYRGEIDATYIDPPYNTDAAPLIYKNGYRHASWLSLAGDRLALGAELMAADAITCVTIDDAEQHRLRLLIEEVVPSAELLGVVAIKNNPAGRTGTVGFSTTHEYALFVGTAESRVGRLDHSQAQKDRYKERDEVSAFEWTNFRKHGGLNTYRTARPRQWYPIYVLGDVIRIPEMTWDDGRREWEVLERSRPGEVELWPVDERGRERIWDFGAETARKSLSDLTVRPDSHGDTAVYRKWRLNAEGLLPQTWWDKSEYSAVEYGTNLLARLFGETHTFTFPKSVHAVVDCLRVAGMRNARDGVVLDYFAGSGTTGHAVINLNREDGGKRKYILVEMGEYFDTVLKPRVLKAAYSKDWKDGKPVGREGVSQLIKIIRLESYEDTLNNLRVERTQQQARLLERPGGERFHEEHALRYWITEDTRGSASLLDLERFEDPWSYTLEVGQGSAAETKPVTVDLVETFNYLLGLRVSHVDHIRGVTLVQGTLPPAPGREVGEKALVIWRNTRETDAEALDKFLWGQRINPRDLEFDVIYVNGDNHLENSRRDEETWKVRLIEEEFHRLMFENADQERKQ